MLKLGVIDYANALPFTAAFQRHALAPPAQLVYGVPTALNKALREGTLDVSAISAAEYVVNAKQYTLLPSLCIGAREKVASVCLYIRNGIKDLHHKQIALTPQSASSALLLKVLCHHFWHVEPDFVTMDVPNLTAGPEGILLIGDQSLQHPTITGYATVDLAQAWYYATGLPFTFAVFAARKKVVEACPEEVAKIEKSLNDALMWATKHWSEVELMAGGKCGLSLDKIRDYYAMLRYAFDVSQREGLQRFAALAEELGYVASTV